MKFVKIQKLRAFYGILLIDLKKGGTAMKVKVDETTCIGCGLCTGLVDGVFEMTDAGISNVTRQPTAEEESEVKNAIDSCPVNAISEE